MLDIDIETQLGDFTLKPRFEAGSEFVVLYGPSGCGKSLTLAAIAGLLRPTRGRMVLPGGVVAFDAAAGVHLPPQQRSVGYVVQDLALFPHLSVEANITFSLSRWPKEARAGRAHHLVDLLGLAGLEQRRPAQLSGGQQQRVALARALAAEPTLLLLDEPFSSLDAPLRDNLRREVAALRRRLDLAVVLVTHDLNEAYALADRIVVMDQGQVLQHGPRDDIFRRPASRRVAELTETRNIVPGDIAAYAEGVAFVRTPWFDVRVRDAAVPIRGKVNVCIRPEHILVLRDGHGARDPMDAVVEVEIIDETATAQSHRLYMRTTENDTTPFVFEVDVPAHPYEVLGIAERRHWRIALVSERMALVEQEAQPA